MSVRKLKITLSLGVVLLIFAAMTMFSASALDGARYGLELCLQTIVPTLLPFFVLSNLLCSLGLPGYLGRWAEPFSRRLFGVGGEGITAFILGITGGYPLGASSVSDLYNSGSITKSEARKLLLFCNNSGPAFIIGMAGVGIFHSASAGVMLYIVHILAAAAVGAALCRGNTPNRRHFTAVSAMNLGPAITSAMWRAVRSTAAISGFVIFFSMLASLLQEIGLFSALAGFMCEHTLLGIGQSESLFLGVLELSSGIASLEGLMPNPGNLALAAFILGWGGISVHFQTAAVLSGTDLPVGQPVLGKLLHGIISAALAYFGAMLIV
ncbi:MAG: nucleoside recognition domain-containing protein [Oscillospiraceae bacterium]